MKTRDEIFAAIVAILLLLLTAWGNATAMLVGSAIGLVACLFLPSGRQFRGSLAVVPVAAAIAIVMVLSRGH